MSSTGGAQKSYVQLSDLGRGPLFRPCSPYVAIKRGAHGFHYTSNFPPVHKLSQEKKTEGKAKCKMNANFNLANLNMHDANALFLSAPVHDT